MRKKKAMSTPMRIRSAKTQIYIAVMISSECTIENGNTMKSEKCEK
jgi:hypothetical protein